MSNLRVADYSKWKPVSSEVASNSSFSSVSGEIIRAPDFTDFGIPSDLFELASKNPNKRKVVEKNQNEQITTEISEPNFNSNLLNLENQNVILSETKNTDKIKKALKNVSEETEVTFKIGLRLPSKDVYEFISEILKEDNMNVSDVLINFYIEESTKNLREKIKNFLEERYSNG